MKKDLTQPEPSLFEFYESMLLIRSHDERSSLLLNYAPNPHIRDLVRKLVNIVITDYGSALFPGSALILPRDKDCSLSAGGSRRWLGLCACRLESIAIKGKALKAFSTSGSAFDDEVRNPLILSIIEHIGRLSEAGTAGASERPEKRCDGIPVMVARSYAPSGPPGEPLPRQIPAFPEKVTQSARGPGSPLPSVPEAGRHGAEDSSPAIDRITISASPAMTIWISSEGFSPQDIPLRTCRPLFDAVERLESALARCAVAPVIEELFKGNTLCSRCGHCCRSLRVEITPEDMETMALHMNITTEDMRRRYLQPSIHSWNEQAGTLNRKLKDGNMGACVFLGHDDLCTIYQARPKVCRGYLPDKKHCLTRLQKGDDRPISGKIERLDITGSMIQMTTRRMLMDGMGPLIFSADQDPHILRCCQSLRDEVKRHLTMQGLPDKYCF